MAVSAWLRYAPPRFTYDTSRIARPGAGRIGGARAVGPILAGPTWVALLNDCNKVV
jgi:hypothetical protein